MREEIRESLVAFADEAYRDFSAGLIPNVGQMLGVRLPILRKKAKEIVKGDWRAEVQSFEGAYQDLYFDETMLRAMVIGYGTQKKDISQEEGIAWLELLIPYIDNWSVCDSFCNTFAFALRHRGAVWDSLQSYLYSDKEYEVRVALILLLQQYLRYDADGNKNRRKKCVTMADFEQSAYTSGRCPYLEQILHTLNREFPQGYYARMAAAWTAAEVFMAFPYEAHQMLSNGCRMDQWTYNKTLQKICESLNPDAEVKQYIRTLKKA